MTPVRGLLLAVLLGACAARAPAGPAWPKLHAGSDDGGESLAPHVVQSGPATPASDATEKAASSSAGSDASAASDDDDDDSAAAADDSGLDGELIIDVDGE